MQPPGFSVAHHKERANSRNVLTQDGARIFLERLNVTLRALCRDFALSFLIEMQPHSHKG